MKAKSLILFGLLSLFFVSAHAQPACYTIDTSRPEWLTAPGQFIRGDANNDGSVSAADVVYLISYLFRGGAYPSCMDAGDAQDNGNVGTGDIVYLLTYLFRGGSAPPPPNDCGPDPTSDVLDCSTHVCMGGPLAEEATFEKVKKGKNRVVLGEVQVVDHELIVPVYVAASQPLSRFAYTIRYDPTRLTTISVENSGLVSEGFDQFSAWIDEEAGKIKVINRVSFKGSETLRPGNHKVANLVLHSEPMAFPLTGDISLTVAEEIFGESKVTQKARTSQLEVDFPKQDVDHGDENISDDHESFMDRGAYHFQEMEGCAICGKDYSSGVNVVNGNLMITRTDFSIPGRGLPIEVTFTYNLGSFFNGRYGFGWQLSHNLRYVTNSENDNVIVVREDDRTDIFVEEVGSFKPTYGVRDSLSQESVGYKLTTKHGIKYCFDSPEHHYITRVEDPNGNTLTYTYNIDKQLTTITDACGRELLLEYTDNKLASITDWAGNQFRYEYDGDELVRVINPLDDTTTYEYSADSCHDLISITDARGNTRQISYNSDYQAETITTCCGTKTFSYDTDNRRTTMTDENDHSTIYTYDEKNRIAQIEDALGVISERIWDDDYNVTSLTDPNGNTTHWTYDSKSNVLTEVNAHQDTASFTWHPVFNKMTSRTDANYHTTTFEYDSHGNLTLQTNPLLDATKYWHDSRGLMDSTRNARGFTTRFRYDDCGNTIETIDAKFFSTSYFYDAVGNVTLVIDAKGNPTRYEYDSLNRLIRTIDALDCTTSFSYDAVGNRISQTNANGDTTRYEYDELNRLVKTTDALEGETQYTYDAVGNRISETDCKGNSTNYEYDQLNRLITRINALNCTTSFDYDSMGNVIAATDANGHATTFEYDALSRLIKIKDAVGCSTIYEYDPVGNRTASIDGNGKVTHFWYDQLDRLEKLIREMETEADSAVTEYEYDEVGNRTAMVDPNGNRTEYEYSERDELTRETNPEGESTLYEYDPVGNRIKVIQPNGNVITYTYDAKNQLINISDSIGQVMSYSYDCVGNRLTETDASNHTTAFEYDALSRLTSVIDPMGESTTYSYDCAGNLDTLVDRNGNCTVYTYDDLSRLISTTNALGNNIGYEYDCVGNQIQITDPSGNTTVYEYDELNRLIREIYADGTTREFTYGCMGNPLTRKDHLDNITTYEYDDLYRLTKKDHPDANDDQFTYDKGSRMLTAQNAYSLVTFDYDGADRVIETAQNGNVIQYAYDVANGRRTINYPGGRIIAETRDRRDRLADVVDSTAAETIAHYVYDLADRLLSKSYLNGTVANYHYNANDWMDSLTHTKGVTLIAGFGYDFGKEGNRKYAENLLLFNPAKQHTHSEKYNYDGVYRLTDFKTGQLVGGDIPSPIRTRTWSLDPVDNWTQFSIDGWPYQATPNQMNEYDDPSTIDCQPPNPGDDDGLPDDFLNRNHAHDCNGNLLNDDINMYEYDYENRLIRVMRKSDGDTLGKYRYDPLGRRIEKDTSGVTTGYLYDGWRVIEERIGGSVEAEYVYGDWIDEVLTMDRDGQTYYYQANSLGSIIALTDSAGDVVERYTYDAYGKASIMDDVGTPLPNSSVSNPYLFTARRLDEETELYYYRTRMYDTGIGRFLSKDPIGMISNINMYSYVGNNPVNHTDPSGAWYPGQGLRSVYEEYVKPAAEEATCVAEELKRELKKELQDFRGTTEDKLDEMRKTTKETIGHVSETVETKLIGDDGRKDSQFWQLKYGNWCGPENKKDENGNDLAPVDQLDECCMTHDSCYIDCESKPLWKRGGCYDDCDDDMCDCLRYHSGSGVEGATYNAAAQGIFCTSLRYLPQARQWWPY